MKIVNLCFVGTFTKNFGYQDNSLSKYQAKLGNDVTVIASRFARDQKNGEIICEKAGESFDDQVKIIRLENRIGKRLTWIFRTYKGLYKTLEKENPELIFVHNFQFLDLLVLKRFLKRHQDVYCAIDSHVDSTNTGLTPFAFLVNKTLWKFCAKVINDYVDVYYGVLPARCNYLNEMYGVPKEKIELLVMGAEDEHISKAKKLAEAARNKLGYLKEDFVIVTGGKIDKYKLEILHLMDIINERDDVKLLIFGSVDTEIKEEFNKRLSKNIKYLGWSNQDQIYTYLCLADFAIFPGRHSVLWEQTVACGIPAAFKRIDGFNHVDLNGNCVFLSDESENELIDLLDYVTKKENLNKMKKSLEDGGKEKFLYSNIAKRSIDNTIRRHNESTVRK